LANHWSPKPAYCRFDPYRPCSYCHMKILPLVIYPAAILKKKAKKADSVVPDFIERMKTTMKENDGVGLAAPQVNISERVIVVQDLENSEISHAFINPRIVSISKEKEEEEEGCLSLPGIFLRVKRPKEITIEAETPEGKTVRIEAEGFASKIFQHEIDHIEGKLIIDRIPLWKQLSLKASLKSREKALFQQK
jgi:peptide deformylase